MGAVRLRIWDRTGERRLDAHGAEPQIDVAGGGRACPAAIVDAARRRLSIDVAYLRAVDADTVELEQLDDGTPPAGFTWRAAKLLPSTAERLPWQRPGWLRDVVAEVDRKLRAGGVRRTGAAIQRRHLPTGALLAIPTDRGDVWLKEVPPVFAHEASVVRWLSGLAPESVPIVLVQTPRWWLAAAYPDWAHDVRGDALGALAEVQAAAASRIGDLRALGCPERQIARLPEAVAEIAERRDLLDSDLRARLAAALPALSARCGELASLGFPTSVAHGDLHPGNFRWTERGWLLTDWTDVHVAHPFVDLTPSLQFDDPTTAARRARAYAAVWAAAFGAPRVARALAASPMVGAAHQMANYAWISDGLRGLDAGEFAGAVGRWSRELLSALARPPGWVAGAQVAWARGSS